MTKKLIFAFAFLLALTFAINAQNPVSSTDGEQPRVIKAVAPAFYPAVALTVRATGRVMLKVEINAEGEVVDTTVKSGHKLLQKSAEIAARRWQFDVVENKKSKRAVQLVFIYKTTDNRNEVGAYFTPPYQVELIDMPPEVLDTPSHDKF